jgi:hypothetical protein
MSDAAAAESQPLLRGEPEERRGGDDATPVDLGHDRADLESRPVFIGTVVSLVAACLTLTTRAAMAAIVVAWSDAPWYMRSWSFDEFALAATLCVSLINAQRN